VVGLLPQPLVETVVELEDGRGVAAPGGGHHPVGQAQEVALDPRRPPRGHAPHHEPLEQHAHARDLREGDGGELGDTGAATRKADDEPLVLQLGEGLAYRDVTYTEAGRKRTLDEPVARGVLTPVDRHAQVICDRIGQALIWKGLERRRHRVARCRRYPIGHREAAGEPCCVRTGGPPQIEEGRRPSCKSVLPP
jgi:hypothetical protein